MVYQSLISKSKEFSQSISRVAAGGCYNRGNRWPESRGICTLNWKDLRLKNYEKKWAWYFKLAEQTYLAWNYIFPLANLYFGKSADIVPQSQLLAFYWFVMPIYKNLMSKKLGFHNQMNLTVESRIPLLAFNNNYPYG